jgi:hypothetical protein
MPVHTGNLRPPPLGWAGLDPRQHILHVPIREILQPRVGGPPGIVFPQDLRHRIGINLLRLRQQSVGLLKVPSRLLVQAFFGEPAGLHCLRRRTGGVCRQLTISHVVLPLPGGLSDGCSEWPGRKLGGAGIVLLALGALARGDPQDAFKDTSPGLLNRLVTIKDRAAVDVHVLFHASE